MTQSSVRYLGSRELHRELPRILDELEDQDSRLILTIHARPKAVILGADAFAALVRQVGELDRKLGEELSSLLRSDKPKQARGKKSTAATHGRQRSDDVRKHSKPEHDDRFVADRQAESN